MKWKLAMVIAMAMTITAVTFGAKNKNKDERRARRQASTATAPASAPATQASAKKIFNKFCAVEQDNPIDPKEKTYLYKGKVIGFCCPDCIDTFKKNPEKYMKTIK